MAHPIRIGVSRHDRKKRRELARHTLLGRRTSLAPVWQWWPEYNAPGSVRTLIRSRPDHLDWPLDCQATVTLSDTE